MVLNQILKYVICMLNMDSYKILVVVINIIFVSIPEETFCIVFTLIILGYFDKCKLKLKYLMQISVPIIAIAILSEVLRFLDINVGIVFSISVFLLYVSILLIYNVSDFKMLWKVLFCLSIPIIIILVLEFSYMPLIYYVTKKNIQYFNKALFLNFLLTLPERVVEFVLIYFLIKKKVFSLKLKIICVITENKVLTILFIIFFLFNITFLVMACILIGYRQVLIKELFYIQLLTIILVLIFPILNLTFMWFVLEVFSKSAAYDYLMLNMQLSYYSEELKTQMHKHKCTEVFRIIEMITNEIKVVIDNKIRKWVKE